MKLLIKNILIYFDNTEVISQLAFQPMMISRADIANRPNDLDIVKIYSKQGMVTGNIVTWNSQQYISADFQSQRQTISVISNTKINKTEATESIAHSDVSQITLPTSFALITGSHIPLQVPKTNI